MDDQPYSQGVGGVDEATLRVVLATGSAFAQEQLGLKGATIVVTAANDAGTEEISASDPSIHGRILQNDADQIAYVKMGTTASATDHSFQLAAGEKYTIPFRYTGVLHARWAATVAGNMRLTELRET